MSKESNVAQALLPKSATRLARQGLLGKSIKEAFLSVGDSLSEVELRIESRLGSDAEQLTEISAYLQQLGGKRVRPLLSLLSARLFGLRKPSQALIDVSAGIELIHMATLLHDDIIDKSPTRRSKPSAFHTYGLTPTLLTGDFLLVRAFGLCAHLDTFIIDATEAACVALTEGELLEGKLDLQRELTLDAYVDIIDKKTASLFTLAAKVGSHVAGAEQEDVLTLTAFGKTAGIAFQMIDDILDVVADEDLLGKPAGADLRQHTPSLLNILWLESGDSFARSFFSTEGSSQEDCAKALAHLKDSEIIEQARGIAQEYADQAIAHLNSLPQSRIDHKTKGQLEALVAYTLDRCM